MDNAREMINWFDGFAKVAEQHGVTDPVLIQNLIKTSWFLDAQSKNPRAFHAAYSEAMAQKQAGFKLNPKHSKILQALGLVKKPVAAVAAAAVGKTEPGWLSRMSQRMNSAGRGIRNTALVGGGLAIGAGTSSAAGQAGDVIHDAVAQERRRKLLELQAQEASMPRASGTPYSGYRV